MATIATETRIARGKVGVLRFSITGALSAGVFFILCWLAALLSIGPAAHMFVRLFADAEITSTLALFQGTCWALLFGLIAGALIALFYNLLGSLDGREI
jgi:uncharacterized membrane protein YhaH (DUF805 family)